MLSYIIENKITFNAEVQSSRRVAPAVWRGAPMPVFDLISEYPRPVILTSTALCLDPDLVNRLSLSILFKHSSFMVPLT